MQSVPLFDRNRPIALLLFAFFACGDESADSSASDGGAGSVNDAAPGADAEPAAPKPNVDRSNPQLYDFELDPLVLDASVVDSLSPQYALLDTQVEPVGRLVFFLPGATNVPANWRAHGRKLAEFGFHVLIPHYDNRWSSEGKCSGMPAGCSIDTRWEALTGEAVSDAVDISRADSAEGRVVTMIKHLQSAHPGGDWGFYLNADDSLRFDRIIIAGISHGASSSGLYATRRAFTRVVMHSGTPAGSVDMPLTPISEWYGLAHTDDSQYDGIVNGWSNASLPGGPTSIDGASPPYGDAHQLTSSVVNCYPHCSTAVSSCSPPENMPVYDYEPAWRYLYGL
jgi:dienelactone hydrolase